MDAALSVNLLMFLKRSFSRKNNRFKSIRFKTLSDTEDHHYEIMGRTLLKRNR